MAQTSKSTLTLTALLSWKKPLCFVPCVCVVLAVLWAVRRYAPSAGLVIQEIVPDMPASPVKEKLAWWKTAIIYQIYPRSFLDTNGDGVGDLNGITIKLDYLKYLGVGAIWISPFYRSPMKDFGYDVSDFRDVDPVFGTLQDFDNLVTEAHKKGLKVIVDFVPNHSSDQHDWFQKSCRRQAPYDDYYIWHDGKRDKHGQRHPPNNWTSICGGSSWTWHEGRGQYYYRAYLPQQPDLNYRNPRVEQEMKNVVRYWLQKGVDGIRVDALEKLFEAQHLKDEPVSGIPGIPSFQHRYLKHIYTQSQPEIQDVVRGWKDVMEDFEHHDGRDSCRHVAPWVSLAQRVDGQQPTGKCQVDNCRVTSTSSSRPPSRFMVIETYAPPAKRNRFYGYGGNPFNHDLVRLKTPLSGTQIRSRVEQEYNQLPEHGWPTFVIGNHDQRRVSGRYGAVYVDVLNMLLLTLKGTPCTYYGEELGMQDINVTFQQTQDPKGRNFGPEGYQQFSRDPERSPMQWDSTQHSGFTSGSSPWLPVHPEYAKRNVKVQRYSKKQTTLQLYSRLARLRRKTAFRTGELIFHVTDVNILSYVRQQPGSDASRYLVILNFGQESSKKDYSGGPVQSTMGMVVEGTSNVADKLRGRQVLLTDVTLTPGEGLVIQVL